MTRFQILSRTDEIEWTEHSVQEAHNAEAAVKAAYLRNPGAKVIAMVAVPLRSWKPTPIRTETVTRVVLGDEPEPAPEVLPPTTPGGHRAAGDAA